MTEEQRLIALLAKQRALERIDRARRSRWSGLAMPRYIQRDGDGHILTVACKKCGSGILDRAGRLDTYQEWRISFNDGSGHVTVLCTDCTRGLSLPELEAIYCADLFELAAEEELTGCLMFWNMMVDRQPTGYEAA